MIAFEGAFHGRTLLSLTLTSKTHPYKAGLGPFAPEVYRVPFPHEYRGISTDDALAALERAFVTQVAAESVAAIVFEPVQGEGGFIVAPREFVEGVREICDEHGIVFVVDEVQTGFGRTGRMFAHRALRRRARPDDRREVDRRRAPALGRPRQGGDHGRAGRLAVGGTYVGNPVAQAAALAVLDVFEEEGLVERAERIGETIRGGCPPGRSAIAQIGDVRGLGAMLAIEFVPDPATKEPAPELAYRGGRGGAPREGLLLLKAGTHSNCIRVLCPLVITDTGAGRGARRLGRGARGSSRVA